MESPLKNKRFLVTGSAGQLGSEWVSFLQASEIGYAGYSSSELDITNKVLVREVIDREKPDFVINCAAYTKVDQAEDEPFLCDRINHLAVGYLAEACAKNGAKLVHYSTDYIFEGSPSDQIGFPDGYLPGHPGNPQSVYGASKWNGEQKISASGADFLIVRVSWLCGKSGKNFVKTMLSLGREREQLRVVDDQFGSPSFTGDTVPVTFKLLENQASGVFHISSEGIISWHEFASEIMQQAGFACQVVPIPTAEYPTKALRPHFSKLDCYATTKITGVPMPFWKDSLRKLIQQLTQSDFS